MVKIRNEHSIVLGAFVLLLAFLNYDEPISMVCFLLFSLYLILDGIFYYKAGILSILLGFAILTSVFIFLIIQNLYLYSFDVLIWIIAGIIVLMLGIMVHSGHLSEKWIRGNLN